MLSAAARALPAACATGWCRSSSPWSRSDLRPQDCGPLPFGLPRDNRSDWRRRNWRWQRRWKIVCTLKNQPFAGQWVEATDTCDAWPHGSSSAVESPVIRCFINYLGKFSRFRIVSWSCALPRSGLSLRSWPSGRPSRGTLETLLLLLSLLL